MLGSENEFVITKAPTHGPGHGAAYRCAEPIVILLLSYPGAPFIIMLVRWHNTFHSHCSPELTIFSCTVKCKEFLPVGSGCGSVGRAVSSNTRDLCFKSSLRQFYKPSTVLNLYRKDVKRVREWPIFKKKSWSC